MSIMKKVALSNTQVFEVVGWYNNDFKKNKRNEVLPLKLQLDLQRNIGSLIEAAQSYEKVCKQLVINVQKEYFTEEKTIEEKKIQKDENGEEKEVFEHILKDEYKDCIMTMGDYNEVILIGNARNSDREIFLSFGFEKLFMDFAYTLDNVTVRELLDFYLENKNHK